jgi:hypothetical protein
MTGWKLDTARAISADGSVIVGTGTNPGGKTEGWMTIIPSNYVPEPANSVYISIGMMSMFSRHRSWRPSKTRR